MTTGIFPLLNVSNLEKTVEFYKGLGLKTNQFEEENMKWGVVASGSGSLWLYPKNATPSIEQPEDTKAWLTGDLGKGVMINIGVPSAAQAWKKAQAIGADVDTPLHDNPWGGQGFSVTDPDGYVIAVSDSMPSE